MLVMLIMAMLSWNSGPMNYRAPTPPAYLASAAERERWQQLRQLKALYEGDHETYFLREQRTQWKFPPFRVRAGVIYPYVMDNLIGLMSVKTADLLFGAKAKIDAPTTEQTDRIDELARRSLLHSRFHAASVQASWSGGAFLEATRWRGQVYVENVPPDEMFPQGRLMPDGQYERYVRYAEDSIPGATADKPIRLLLETSYEPGFIRRRLYRLNDDGTRSANAEQPLDRWPAFAGDPPLPDTPTGLAQNTITYVANVVGGDKLEVSDYAQLISLQDTVNAKWTQVAMILAKHANPKLRGPRAAAEGDGNLSSESEVVFSDAPDEWGYLTWDGNPDAAMRDRDAAIDALCTSGEMPPSVLGISRTVTADSARKMRLMASSALAKVARKALVMEPAMARAIETAQRLDQTGPMLRSFAVDAIGVHVRDSLPVDPADLANEASIWRSAGLMSLEDGVAMRVEDPDAAFAEIERIKAENEAKTPSILLGSGVSGTEPGEIPAGAGGAGAGSGSQEQQTGEAA